MLLSTIAVVLTTRFVMPTCSPLALTALSPGTMVAVTAWRRVVVV